MTPDHSALIERLVAGPQSGCAELPGWEELCAEAATALRDLTEWRDIADAPEDGPEVLAVSAEGEVAVVLFSRNLSSDVDRFVWNWPFGNEPVAWLPLPSAPNQAKEAGE